MSIKEIERQVTRTINYVKCDYVGCSSLRDVTEGPAYWFRPTGWTRVEIRLESPLTEARKETEGTTLHYCQDHSPQLAQIKAVF